MRYWISAIVFETALLSACKTLPDQPVENLKTETTETTSCEDILITKNTDIEAVQNEPKAMFEEKPTLKEDIKSYPSLVYGEPLPFVCHSPIPAEGILYGRPNLQIMWENYIHDRPGGVWGEVGGLVEYNGLLPEDQGGWRNACAVRMSYMLNKAGFKLPHIEGKTVSGAEGNYYFFRLENLQNFLTKKLGPPDFEYNHGPSRWQELPPHPGILIQRYPGSNFTGHATIWNGAGTVDNADIGGYRILYWKTPCYVPEGREFSLGVGQ